MYTIVQSLENKNLVEKELTESATKYAAIALNDGISMLIENKKAHVSELTSKTKAVISQFEDVKQSVCDNSNTEESIQYIKIIPKRKVIIERRRRAIRKAKMSIDIVTSKRRFSTIIIEYADDFYKALKKGVNIRIATEKHVAEKAALEVLQTLMKEPNFEVRYFQSPVEAIVGIFDQKEVCIMLSTSTHFSASSSLWSNNKSITSIVQTYFENKWANSEKQLNYNKNTNIARTKANFSLLMNTCQLHFFS